MNRYPKPVTLTVPVPTPMPAIVDLSDDCTLLDVEVDGHGRSLSLFPCTGHQLADVEPPFLSGDLTFEQANDVPGLPPGRYLVLKKGAEALAAAEIPPDGQ